MKLKLALIGLVTVIITGGLAASGAYGYVYQKTHGDKVKLQGMVNALQEKIADSAIEVAPASAPAGMKEYKNAQYGFIFDYPDTWTGTGADVKQEDIAVGENGIDELFKISFTDPITQLQISCINNESQSWKDATPTKDQCSSVLASMTQEEKDALGGPSSAKNIFVRVNKATTQSVSDWLTSSYKKGGEAAQYVPGKQITMAGISGNVSQIGCCAGYDLSYVIKKDDYIYSIGTNFHQANTGTLGMTGADQDNTLLQQMAATFKLFTPDPTADWKTYTNTADGYSIKYPADWAYEYSNGVSYAGDPGNDTKELYISPAKIVQCAERCVPGPYSATLSISATGVPTGGTLDSILRSLTGSWLGLEKTSVTIGGQAGYKAVDSCETDGGVGCDDPLWLTLYKGKSYKISSNLSYQATYDTIVSTLKFTN